MRILLPPSETKRLGGRLPFSPRELFLGERLAAPRAAAQRALESVSGDESAATKALKLGVKNRDERLRNLELDASGAMPAIERYTGVLYDALDPDTLAPEALAWLRDHVFVQSALFGLVRGGDAIPAYRVSASSRLPELGSPLAKLWAAPHEGALEGSAYVLDLRSKDYAALAPLGALGAEETDYLEVVARSDDGEVRALNHFNKAAKGDLVRRLAESAPAISSRSELLEWARATGLELGAGADASALRLVTLQGVPAASR
ncbi:YaaA family protein [Leucobacter sp. NPDC015123]|uniref:YaaA family protein n=1 Tax=Leucobacter sp. NPDC015123 TaxID=3364129 RepID=UPI0036F49CED